MGLEHMEFGLDHPEKQGTSTPPPSRLFSVVEKIRKPVQAITAGILGFIGAHGVAHPASAEDLSPQAEHQTVPARDLTIPETWEIPLPETVQETDSEAEEPAVLNEEKVALVADTPAPELTAGQALGGGTAVPTPQETTRQLSELFETTPQGRLATEKFPEGTPGWKPRQTSAGQTDGFFNEAAANIILRRNLQLRGGVGNSILWPDLNNMREPDKYGIVSTFVDPNDPRTLIAEYNFFRPDFQPDPDTRDSIERQAAGAIGRGLSKVIYGQSMLDGTLTQDQRNYLAQRDAQLQDIGPLELVAPTTS